MSLKIVLENSWVCWAVVKLLKKGKYQMRAGQFGGGNRAELEQGLAKSGCGE